MYLGRKAIKDMTKARHNGRRKASALGKTGAERSAYVMKRETLAVVKNLRLMDDTFMSKCLENAPKSLQGRGVRFDVFARDSKGREYDIEIQRAKDGAEPKRARYNSALMDANALKSGEDFDKLRDTYVIFITENDMMGGGKDVYHVNRMIEELGCRAFGDGTHIIYVNGATRSATDVGRLIHDLLCRDAADMYFDVLRKRVNEFKKSEEGRLTMCEAVEEFAEKIAVRREARGKREGRREAVLALAKKLLANGKLMLKEIAECTGLSLVQVKELKASMA